MAASGINRRNTRSAEAMTTADTNPVVATRTTAMATDDGGPKMTPVANPVIMAKMIGMPMPMTRIARAR